MSELPQGWSESKLGDLLEYVTSGSRDWSKYYAEEGALFVRTQDINKNKLSGFDTVAKVKLPEKVEGKRTLIQKDDILLTITGANVGKCAHVERDIPEAYVSQSVALVRLIDKSLAKFVHKQLISPGDGSVQTKLEASAYGMGRPVLNLDNVREVSLNIAPLSEQIRIAQKLDELLAQVDTLKARIDAIPALLKRFRQSVLAAAVSGRLTEGWRESNPESESPQSALKALENDYAKKLELRKETGFKRGILSSMHEKDFCWEIPVSWVWSSWGTLADWITYGFTRPMKHVEYGAPIVTAKNVRMGFLDFDRCHFAAGDEFKALSDKDRPLPGDMLITKDGTIGRAALVGKNTPDEFCINQSVAVVWLRTTHIDGRYLELIVQAEPTQRFIQEYAKGMAIPHLSITDFARSPVPVPSVAEQTEIVRRVEQLFAFADQLESKVQTAKARIDLLSQSILAKAFRGELVPQDPDDEPASVLLERIRAQRAAQPKARRGRQAAAAN